MLAKKYSFPSGKMSIGKTKNRKSDKGKDKRYLLSFLPSNYFERAPVVAAGDDVNRMDNGLTLVA
ncbi:MAG: hypothetical protein ACRDBM_07410 [Sporomusa sp.]